MTVPWWCWWWWSATTVDNLTRSIAAQYVFSLKTPQKQYYSPSSCITSKYTTKSRRLYLASIQPSRVPACKSKNIYKFNAKLGIPMIIIIVQSSQSFSQGLLITFEYRDRHTWWWQIWTPTDTRAGQLDLWLITSENQTQIFLELNGVSFELIN